jgi:hypothetical protein
VPSPTAPKSRRLNVAAAAPARAKAASVRQAMAASPPARASRRRTLFFKAVSCRIHPPRAGRGAGCSMKQFAEGTDARAFVSEARLA